MKKLLIISGLVSVLITFQNCNKKVHYNDDEVTIAVVVDNKYDLNNPKKIYSNEMVYLREKGSENYLYGAKTDNEGKVVFSLLEKDKEYEVFVQDTINGLPFNGSVNVRAPNSSLYDLILNPNTELFNGFQIKCVDNQGAGIPGIDVCLFESQILAGTGDCAVSTLSGVTSSHGVYMATNIPSRYYYISIIDTIASIPIAIIDSIEVTKTGVNPKQIEVIP